MVPLQQQVAGAYNGAVQGTQQAMGMNLGMTPMMAQTSQAGAPAATAQGYNAFTGVNAQGQPMAGYGAGTASGSGYNAAQMGPVANVTAGQFAGMDMNPYMNPYLNNVVDQTQADMERARLVEQNATNDAMTAAGAFGGSRHGIANAETNRNYYDRLGSTMGQLRNLGFQNAQQAAFQDIGNTMQADLANQNVQYNVGAGNRDATNQARMTGANNSTSASIANANNTTAMNRDRFDAVNRAREFGADANNAVSQFNSRLGADLSIRNADATDYNSRFNADTFNTANQNRFTNQMNAANQFAGLADQGFNMANTIAGNQQADGQTAQAAQQALINAAMQQFAGYTGAGNLGLGNLQSGVAAVPGGSGQTTNTSNPGLGGLLSLFL
jgi:hypothetical protein